MQLQALFTLLPALAALPAINAYFILSHPVLETTRLDPIVDAGGIGSHVHSIVGGNNFDKEMTYESARNSTCTTAPITVDKSNYWIPQLYYYKPDDETFQMVPIDYVNTYYLPRAGSDGLVQAFPDGLRMVSGNPNRRTYNGDADSNAISYVCLDYTTSHTGDAAWDQRNSFFEHNCPSGMRAQVNFRPCWDGVNLDSDDHQSHMAWPSGGVDGGDCPSDHPVHLVSLFYEFIYNVQDFPYNNGTDPTWVWANGDTTGYGLHGDFLNGWPSYANGTGILQQAIDQCNDDNGVGGVLSACPPFVDYIDSEAANACKPANDLVDEDIGNGHYIAQLPGDNPIWIGNDTTKPSYANYTDDGIGFTDGKSVIPTGYSLVGCIAEGTSGRALTGKSFSNANMTLGVCVSWCESFGYPLAGVEYADECYCDFAMRNGASNTTLLSDDQCGMTCANNTNENCGGSATLTLYNNPALYPVASYPAGWSAYGCMTEASGARALSGYSTSSSSMTQELCMNTCKTKGYTYAGVEYSSECYCGNTFNTGSVAATSGCSMACSGNSLETCGGGNRLTTFVYSNSTTTSSVSASTSASTSTAANTTTVAATSSASKSANTTTVVSTSTASTAANTTTVVATSTASKAANTTTVVPTSTAANTTTVASTTTVIATSSASKAANTTTVASTSAASNTSTVAAATSTSTSKASSASSSVSTATSTASSTTSSVTSASSSSSSSSSTSKASSSSSSSITSTSTSASSSASASKSSSSSSSSVASTSTTSTAAAAATTVASGYVGCFSDINTRMLNGTMISNTTMTNDNCQAYCNLKGYAFAGNEYTRECWCGNYLNMTLQIAQSKCSYPCAGNSAESCGGSMILSVFATGSGTQHVYGSSSISKRFWSAKWRL